MSGWHKELKTAITSLKECQSDDDIIIEVEPQSTQKRKKDSFDFFLNRVQSRNQTKNTVNLVDENQKKKEKKEIDLTKIKQTRIETRKEGDKKVIIGPSQQFIDVERVSSKQNLQKYKKSLFNPHERSVKRSFELPPKNPNVEMKKQMQIIQDLNKPNWIIQKQKRRSINKEKYPISYTHSYVYNQEESNEKQFSGLNPTNDVAHQEYLRKREERRKEMKEKKKIEQQNEKIEKEKEKQRRLKQQQQEDANYISEMIGLQPNKKIKENTESAQEGTHLKNEIVEQLMAAQEEVSEIAQLNRVQQRYGIKDIIKNNQTQMKTFTNTILKHDYSKTEELPEEKRIPQNFHTDISMYRITFNYLITTECIADIKHRLKSLNQSVIPIKVRITQHRTNTDHHLELRLRNLEKEEESQFRNLSLSRFRLGLICSSSEYRSEYYGIHRRSKHFAFLCLFVTPQTKDELYLDVKVKAIVSEAELEMKMRKMKISEVYFFDLQKITTQLREYLAVCNIMYSELAAAILDPKLVERQQTVFVEHRHILDSIMTYLNQIFNQTQYQSIRQMVMREKGFVLLQGPPGTGKTSTLMGLLSAQYDYLKSMKDTRKIMICAPSNAAVDHIVKRIKTEGLFNGEGEIINPEILRVGVVETDDPAVRSVSLDDLCQKQVQLQRESAQTRNNMTSAQLKQKIIQLQKQLRNAKNKPEEGNLKKELQRYEDMMYSFRSEKFVVNRKTYNAIESHLLHKAEIILTTLTSSGSEKIDTIRGEFACLIVDEAAQATEPNLLIALQTGVQKVLLIGDPYQLPATCMSQDANVTLFNRSLFQRFIDASIKPYFLNIQYRMAPKIRGFPSSRFYSGRLKDADSILTRPLPDYLSNFEDRNVLFLDVPYGSEQKRGDSYCNIAEVKVVSLLIRCLLHPRISLGLITPYQNQKKAITSFCSDTLKGSSQEMDIFEKNVMINTVDSFQGQQKDIIVVSTVRANGNQVGFLTDQRRINVTLTRAKHLLIVVGHGDTMGSNEVWNEFLEWAERDKCYYIIDHPSKTQDILGEAFQSFSNQKVRRIRHTYLSTDIRKIKRREIQSEDFISSKKSKVPSWIQQSDRRRDFIIEQPSEVIPEDTKHALDQRECQEILQAKKQKEAESLQQEQMLRRMQRWQEQNKDTLKDDEDYKFLFN